MPKPATTRLGIPQYEDSEGASFSAQVDAISAAVDAKACVFIQGTFAARPAASIQRRYYLATDGTKSGCPEGDLYYDTGTAWVGPRNVPTFAPLGSMMDYALAADPVDADGVTRWMIANGRAISRETYATLFNKIVAEGLLSAWGEGNGTTTFNIPSLVGRTAVHPDGAVVTGVGATGGESAHTLSAGELPPLWLPNPAGGHLFAETAYSYHSQPGYAASDGLVSNLLGGAAHNNMQPFVGLYKIIRVL